MDKKVVSRGKDYTFMLPMFKELVLQTGIKAGGNLIFAGCPGPCYSFATYFGFGLRDLNLNLYYAPESDINHLHRLEYLENVGIVASRKAKPVKAKVIVLMSGLCRIPFEHTRKFIAEALASDGVIIGESVAPGIFEAQGWDKEIPFDALFEFSIQSPTSYRVGKRTG